MSNEVNSLPRLNICMLLPLRYDPKMRVNPQIGIGSYLSHFGHLITWVLSSEKIRSIAHTSFHGTAVHVVPYAHYFGVFPPFGRAVSKAIYALRRKLFILKIAREGKYDIIFVRDDVFDGLIASYIKKRDKIPLVFELSSPLEEGWETAKAESEKQAIASYLINKFWALMRIYIMKNADLVLPTTSWFDEELVKRGIPSTKLMPFPNGADMEAFANTEGRDIRDKYHLGSSKVIIYLGVIGKVRKLEVLIRAFAMVKEERRNVKLLMVGDGTGRKDLQKLAGELGLEDDVIFTGQVQQSKVPNFIAAADIGIDPRPPTSYYMVSSPIKTFEYMAMGKPSVVSVEVMENKEVIEQSGGGILAPFTSEAFANAIIEMLDHPEKAMEMGRKGYEWLVKNRTFEILARKLEAKYFQLAKRR